MTIASNRLDLAPIDIPFMEALRHGDAAHVIKHAKLSAAPAGTVKSGTLQRRIAQLRADPSLQPWLLRSMIRREDRIMVGYLGFHTAPAPAYLKDISPSGIEMGYTVFEPYRRRGYAQEAITALMGWAIQHHQVWRFVVSISPSNLPSMNLAIKLGFNRISSHIDEIDGPEDILEFRRASSSSSSRH